MRADRIRELEEKLAEVKERWPGHPMSPEMWQRNCPIDFPRNLAKSVTVE